MSAPDPGLPPGVEQGDGPPTASDSVDCCKELLRSAMAEKGIEADVTCIAPLLPSPYDPFAMTCPHGVGWFMQPTRRQIAKWQKESVE